MRKFIFVLLTLLLVSPFLVGSLTAAACHSLQSPENTQYLFFQLVIWLIQPPTSEILKIKLPEKEVKRMTKNTLFPWRPSTGSSNGSGKLGRI